METINIKLNLYSYDELEGKAKEKAFDEHKEFLDNLGFEVENERGILSREYEDTETEIVEDSLRINEYYFFKDGNMANTCCFTDGHEKTGIVEFYFNGETYVLKDNSRGLKNDREGGIK
jgi:hypothetical protein